MKNGGAKTTYIIENLILGNTLLIKSSKFGGAKQSFYKNGGAVHPCIPANAPSVKLPNAGIHGYFLALPGRQKRITL